MQVADAWVPKGWNFAVRFPMRAKIPRPARGPGGHFHGLSLLAGKLEFAWVMATLFKRILVPHDFSATATHALRVAADLASRHGGRVTVLHVLTPFYSGPGYPTQDEIAWTPPAEIADERRRHLEQIVREALGASARGITCKVVMGEAVPAILGEAAHADAIVMTTIGRTGLAHLLVGSVAEKVVRHATVPVLTLRPPAAKKGTTRGSRKRASDGSRR